MSSEKLYEEPKKKSYDHVDVSALLSHCRHGPVALRRERLLMRSASVMFVTHSKGATGGGESARESARAFGTDPSL